MQPLNEPIATDVDSGITAIHHTLGFGAFQASPGSHRHDGSDSHQIKLENLQGVSIAYTPVVGTSGTQPTFNGDPLVTGSYTKIGNICFFQVTVSLSNILTFGTGQYYINLPFASEHFVAQRNGILVDSSASTRYQISGMAQAGSSQLMLYSQTSNGLDTVFDANTPVALATADSFHIAGTYEIMP